MAPPTGTLPRHVEPEWLDVMATDDPRAQRSRRDLRRVNVLMRHAGMIARALTAHGTTPRLILDLGCGDGSFMLAVARQLAPRWRNVTVLLLDQQNLVSRDTRQSFAKLDWRAEPVAADLIDFLGRDAAAANAIVANLVLHHFDAAELTLLLRLIARRTGLFVACEPRRDRMNLAFSRMLWAIGCNTVTRHDAPASVRAGFRGAELSAQWPDRAAWELHEGAAGLFSHRFVARAL
jgi:SAM-dependent methyltransferase